MNINQVSLPAFTGEMKCTKTIQECTRPTLQH